MFKLTNNWNDASQFKDDSQWRCYIGGTTYDPSAEGGPLYKGLDWYYNDVIGAVGVDKFFSNKKNMDTRSYRQICKLF